MPAGGKRDCTILPEKSSLSPKQEKFLLAYLATHNICVASRTAGINESTGHRWLKLDEFQEVYQAAQKRIFEEDLSGLCRLIGKAIQNLEDTLDDPDTPRSVKVRASEIIIAQSRDIVTNAEIDQRLKALEELARFSRTAGGE